MTNEAKVNYEYVYIPSETSLEVERRFFEYNSALNVVRYLMSQPTVNKKILNEYIKTVEGRGVELDLWKQNISQLYPASKDYNNYVFEFDYNRIKYY